MANNEALLTKRTFTHKTEATISVPSFCFKVYLHLGKKWQVKYYRNIMHGLIPPFFKTPTAKHPALFLGYGELANSEDNVSKGSSKYRE